MFIKNLVIEDVYFTIILTILFLFTTFLIAKGSLTDNRFKKKWWKKVNSRGWTVILVNLLIIIIYIFQSINNSNLLALKNEELKKEQDGRAEMIKDEVKNEMDQLFQSISTAFSNQGIKIDSLQNIISKQREVNYVTNNSVNEAEPWFHIKMNSLRLENDGFYYSIFIKDAGVANLDAKYMVLAKWSNGSTDFISNRFLSKDMTFPANTELQDMKLVDFKDANKKLEDFSVQFKGNYTNLVSSKNYRLDYVYSFDKKLKKFRFQHDESKDSVLMLMRNANKKNRN